MKRLMMVALGAMTLSGCTGTHLRPPPVCDGKHRRPANLYGSVLPTLPVPLAPSQSAGQAPTAVASPPPADPAPPAGTGRSAHGADAANAPPPPHSSERDITLSFNRC